MFSNAFKFKPSLSNFRVLRESSVSAKTLMESGVLSINEEVKYALEGQHPVVALESTIITHGLPYPDNVKCAIDVENEIRRKGAVPATIAILNGIIKAGLTHGEIEALGNIKKSSPIKTSRRDFPYVISKSLNGGTTVSGTLIVADKLGIPIFATGGIGGVHREGETTFDVSADLTEMGRSRVAVVSSGVKSILDIPKTLEYLETQGVFVATIGPTTDFPAFYSRKSGSQAPYSIPNAIEASKIIFSSRKMDLRSGMLLCVPVPEEHALDDREIQEVISKAVTEAKKNGVSGKQITPFLLRKISEITHGKSLRTNVALIKNNASVAASIAVELSKLKKSDGNSELSTEKSNGSTKDIVVIGGSNLDLCAKIDEGGIKLDGRSHPSKLSYVAGGVARNMSDALTKLGCKPHFVTAIGDDEPGKLLQSLMPTSLMGKSVRIIKGEATAQCIIILDSDGDCSCLLANYDIHKHITPQMIRSNEESISKAKLIIIDGNLTIETTEEILKMATELQIPVFFEPTDVIVANKPFETNYWKAVKFITPNKQELKRISTKLNIPTNLVNNLQDIEELARIAEFLLNYIENIIVTLGSEGVLIARKANASDPFLGIKRCHSQIRHYPAEKIEGIVNVSGAGDSFASGLITAMLKGLPEEICISVGFAAAKCALRSCSTVADSMISQSDSAWRHPASYHEIKLK